jgi:hypothetical protein
MAWRYYSDNGVDKFVEVVVEPDYRGNLQELAKTRVVWIVDTPQNRPAIDAIWEVGAHANLCEVNRYTVPDLDPNDRDGNLINIVISLDTHYYPYPGFVVHGAVPSVALIRALAAWHFEIAETTEDGFIAKANEEIPETTNDLGK